MNQTSQKIVPVVTWREAETALVVALEAERASPDRERAFLRSGSRTAWPNVLHDAFDAYGQTDMPPPRRMLAPREITLRDLLLHGADGREPLANRIPEGRRQLVAWAAVMLHQGVPERKLWPMLWKAYRARLRGQGKRITVTADGLAEWYSDAIKSLARALTAVGWQPYR